MVAFIIEKTQLRTGDRIRQKGTGRLGTIKAFISDSELLMVQWDDHMIFDILVRDIVPLTVARPTIYNKSGKR